MVASEKVEDVLFLALAALSSFFIEGDDDYFFPYFYFYCWLNFPFLWSSSNAALTAFSTSFIFCLIYW